MSKSSITYSLDGADLAAVFGVYISGSRGVLDLPSLKQPQIYDWADYHGVIVDLDKPRYKKWVKDNADRIEAARSRDKLPWFLKNNEGFWNIGSAIFEHPVSGKIIELSLPFDPPLPREVHYSQDEARGILQNMTDSEKAFIFAKDKRVYELSHAANSPFEIDLKMLNKRVYEDSFAIHNHPGGGTFSYNDVSAFLSYKMRRVEVVSDVNNTRYILRRKDSSIAFNEEEFRKKWDSKSLYYQITARSKNATSINSKVLSDLSNEFGFIYQISNPAQ